MDSVINQMGVGEPAPIPANPNPGIYNGELLYWKGWTWQVSNTGSMEDGSFIVLLVQKNETSGYKKRREKHEKVKRINCRSID